MVYAAAEEKTPLFGTESAPYALMICRLFDNMAKTETSEIAKLMKMMKIMKGIREDLQESSTAPVNKEMQSWITKLREASYYIEEAIDDLMLTRPTPPRRSSWFPSLFTRPERSPIPLGAEEPRRAKELEDFKQTMDGRLVMDCLRHYSSIHRADDYEPIPDKVTQHHLMHGGICWTYGSFVASRKYRGCFFAPRTRFFFELASRDGFSEVVTCAPSLGETYCTTVDIIAAAAAKVDMEARRLRATKAPAVCVVMSGDRLEEGMTRANTELMSTRPASVLRSSGMCLPIVSTFSHLDPGHIPIGEPLNYLQLKRLEEKRRRTMDPGHFKQLTMDDRLVMDCLHHYNSMHLGDEYESAPGKVTRHCHMHNGLCWTHGNFMARRKRSGFLSFMPTPRTLFFFELAFKDGFDQVVTCTPLLDEPVTEAYTILGFPLWWSTRRSGRLDCICKTCNRRLDVLHPDLKRTFACGHKEVERVCKMCHQCSNVLHPSRGEFAFGYSSM